jgi:hypothetical protein
MLAFKHNVGGYGTPGTLASNAETSGGTISSHTAIDECFATLHIPLEALGNDLVFPGDLTVT